jgi:hypothetical protein
MWKAYLESINQPTNPDDTVVVNIKFEDAANGKTMTKQYQLVASNYQNVQAVKDLVTGELAKLNKFDTVVALVQSYVGKEIK